MRWVRVYLFEELPREAQDRAIEDAREDIEYPWHEDNLKSLETFEQEFPVKASNWSYGGDLGNHYITCECTEREEVMELEGLRLRTWIINNLWDYLYEPRYLGHVKDKPVYSKVSLQRAMPTGRYLDVSIRDPFHNFIDKFPSCIHLHDILMECLGAWVRECSIDVKSTQSDEYLKDLLIANEYEFMGNGRFYY